MSIQERWQDPAAWTPSASEAAFTRPEVMVLTLLISVGSVLHSHRGKGKAVVTASLGHFPPYTSWELSF